MNAKRAAAIINDIHEGMCKATKKELMECASFYSLRCCTLYQAASSAYTQTAINAFEGLDKFRKEHNQ